MKDRDSRGDQIEDFVKEYKRCQTFYNFNYFLLILIYFDFYYYMLFFRLKYIVECVERNQKIYTSLIPPNKILLEDPLTKIANLRDYCYFFIRAIRENLLWKYANVGKFFNINILNNS